MFPQAVENLEYLAIGSSTSLPFQTVMAKTSNMSISADTSAPPAQSGGNAFVPSNPSQSPKGSKYLAFLAHLGVTIPILKTMFKGALPPTIAIAIYQSNGVAERYRTLGNLIAIVSILSLCTLPRMKFLQTMFLNILGTCLACAMSFLGLVLSTKARSHSETRTTTEYNSSASVVCAIFLFLNIYAINTMRAQFPALQFPAICYSIYMAVCFTDMPTFNMSSGSAFIWRMTETFLTGFAIAAGVSLLIFPLSSRAIMFRQLMATIGALRRAIHPRPVEQQSVNSSTEVEKKDSDGGTGLHQAKPTACREAIVQSANLCQNFSKLLVDMAAGKLEVAWGNIDAAGVDELAQLLRALLIPTLGLTLRGDIFRDLADPTIHLLQEISQMGQFINSALDHVSLKLGLAQPPGKQATEDVDAVSFDGEVGQGNFEKLFREALVSFRTGREQRITTWMKEKTDDLEIRKGITETSLHTREQFAQQQLYMLLYIEHLMESCATSAFNLIKFADQICETKNHLIFPSDLLQSYRHHFIHAPEDPEHTVTRSEKTPTTSEQCNRGILQSHRYED